MDFWHLSWEPQGLKELKQLSSHQVCVFEHQQAHKQYHHSWSHVVFLSILWFVSNAENKGACVSPSYKCWQLYHRLLHSLFLSKTAWSFTDSILIKWCRKLYPTLRNIHPDSMHTFPAQGRWTSSLTFVINFFQDSSFYQLLSALSHWYFPFQGCKQNTNREAVVNRQQKWFSENSYFNILKCNAWESFCKFYFTNKKLIISANIITTLP